MICECCKHAIPEEPLGSSMVCAGCKKPMPEAFAMVRIGEQEFLIGDGGDCWLLYAKVAGVILLEAPLLLLKDVDHLDPDAESD